MDFGEALFLCRIKDKSVARVEHGRNRVTEWVYDEVLDGKRPEAVIVEEDPSSVPKYNGIPIAFDEHIVPENVSTDAVVLLILTRSDKRRGRDVDEYDSVYTKRARN